MLEAMRTLALLLAITLGGCWIAVPAGGAVKSSTPSFNAKARLVASAIAHRAR